MSPHLIDLSHPLTNDTPPFPGDPPVEVVRLASTDQTDFSQRASLNCGKVHLPIHCATHMDAPFHFFADRVTIEQVPLERCLGTALMVDCTDPAIGAEHLAPYGEALAGHDCAILNTGWYRQWGQPGYFSEHPVLTQDAAQFLVDVGIGLVGVDFPSVDRTPHEAHLVLLGNNVLIVENLTNLAAIGQDTFDFSAIPLAIAGGDGSPVRAMARIDR